MRVKIVQSAISSYPAIKYTTFELLLQACIKEAKGMYLEGEAMTEGPKEEVFACMVKELQQEEKIELKFQMKFRQQLLTVSSIMACP